jgi:hypothetical protein
MSFVTTNEKEYFYDVPFAGALEDYALANQICLGNFKKCVELHRFDGTSSYMVDFIRLTPEGRYKKVVAFAVCENDDWKFTITEVDPV